MAKRLHQETKTSREKKKARVDVEANQSDDLIHFFCKAKSYYELSNFYQCDVTMGQYTFPSTEHAFQYYSKVRKGENDDHIHDWLIGGNFANWDYVYDKAGKKLGASWKTSKKKPIGILAKFVVSNPTLFEIEIQPYNAKTRTFEFWEPILLAKFQNKPLKQLLLNTNNNRLVEYSRGAERVLYEQHFKTNSVGVPRDLWRTIWKSYTKEKRKEINEEFKGTVSVWCGIYNKDDGYVYGNNLMGNFIMKIRDILNK